MQVRCMSSLRGKRSPRPPVCLIIADDRLGISELANLNDQDDPGMLIDDVACVRERSVGRVGVLEATSDTAA